MNAILDAIEDAIDAACAALDAVPDLLMTAAVLMALAILAVQAIAITMGLGAGQ